MRVRTMNPGGWRYYGQERPPFAIEPKPGEESAWDYPRPPRIEPELREVVVCAADVEIARTRRAIRVLETASPPAVYVPADDLAMGHLRRISGTSHCEWKGTASYWSVVTPGVRLDAVAWSYETPLPEFDLIRGHLAFYPGRIECYVDGIRVEPQPGGFYGGWITPGIVGPFKGEPGTYRW